MGEMQLQVLDFPASQQRMERRPMPIKRIPIDALAVGMYVVRLDKPWPEYPRLVNIHHITSPEDIALLREHGVRYVIIDPTLGRDVTEKPQEEVDPQGLHALARELAVARAVRREAMTALQSIFEGVKSGAPIKNVEVKKTVHTLMDTILRRYDPLLSLIHMQRHDADMFAHAVNVCAFALVVGKNQGYDKVKLEQLGIGALLHDVGELRLPRNLLQKPGVYTEQERRLVQQHPRLGVNILSQSDDVHQESLRIVLEHHERIDGSGYPAGLKGLEISPLSEIVGIVDIYDAMLSSREGRPPLPPAQAVKQLFQDSLKGHLDRRWVERVIRCLGIYPVGSLVELSTGERGIVTATNPTDALRPSVRLISDAAQQPYSTPQVVDLAAPREHEPERTILRALDPAKENLGVAAYLEESE
jgi:HD-GYP domain-containing protein (c-di-GMP phosphodiesterase class II)